VIMYTDPGERVVFDATSGPPPSFGSSPGPTSRSGSVSAGVSRDWCVITATWRGHGRLISVASARTGGTRRI